ncbi:MAG: tetratricopeptide repeat protein [Gemmatimonadota bacterium]|nr:tetratricopeptide repeat protein [Gemmatimonadota bacterium]
MHSRFIPVFAAITLCGALGACRGDTAGRESVLSDSLPSIQYRAPSGINYRAEKDTGAVAHAAAALAADPRNVARIVALGVAQSGARQFQEAIVTFTNGMKIAPDSAILYRWRGHRYLSVREFDKAMADFNRGLQLDSNVYGIWYHLGVLKFLHGDFNGAAAAFKRAQPMAPNAGEAAGSTDWLWMSLERAGRGPEAVAMLAQHADSLPTEPNYAYTKRLRMYRGEIAPSALFTPADTADVQVATLSFGLGNWYMVKGDTVSAKAAFERAIKSGGWPGFGFIVSEAELKRLGK